MMGTGAAHQVDRVGVLTPEAAAGRRSSGPGEIGFITASIKEIADCAGRRHDHRRPQAGRRAPLPGFRPSPAGGVLRHVPDRCRRLRATCATAWASCASTTPASSTSPRAARRARPRLPLRLSRPAAPRDHPGAPEREFDLDLVITAPSVVYRVHQTDGSVLELHNPADYPDPTRIDHVEEPWIKATILVPDEYPGQRAGAVHREARRAGRADLCRHTARWWSTGCR